MLGKITLSNYYIYIRSFFMSKYQIFTDSSSDLTTEMRKEHNIDYFRMAFTVDGSLYDADLDYQEYSAEQLYEWIKTKNVKTSLITVQEFHDRMIPYLEKGYDILYLACTMVLSGSLNVFRLAVEDLQEKYPDRKMIGVDTHRAGMVEGMIVMDAASLQKQGKSMEEVIEFVEKERLKYNLCGTLETLTYLKKAGRVSGAAAFFGNLFAVKPIIIADTLGHNYVVSKAKGSKNAYLALFDIIKDAAEGQEHPVIYVGQGMAQETAAYFKKRFEEELGATVIEYWVGPIIGISCGPGVIHLNVKGKEVIITSPEK